MGPGQPTLCLPRWPCVSSGKDPGVHWPASPYMKRGQYVGPTWLQAQRENARKSLFLFWVQRRRTFAQKAPTHPSTSPHLSPCYGVLPAATPQMSDTPSPPRPPHSMTLTIAAFLSLNLPALLTEDWNSLLTSPYFRRLHLHHRHLLSSKLLSICPAQWSCLQGVTSSSFWLSSVPTCGTPWEVPENRTQHKANLPELMVPVCASSFSLSFSLGLLLDYSLRQHSFFLSFKVNFII